MIDSLSIMICFTCRTTFKMALTIYQKWFYMICRFFVKKIKLLCSSDHLILFKFCQLVVNIVSKGTTNRILNLYCLQWKHGRAWWKMIQHRITLCNNVIKNLSSVNYCINVSLPGFIVLTNFSILLSRSNRNIFKSLSITWHDWTRSKALVYRKWAWTIIGIIPFLLQFHTFENCA